MRHLLALAALPAFLAAAPAAAVTIANISVTPNSSVTAVTEAPGFLEVDIALANFDAIGFNIVAGPEDGTSFEFNALVDVLTGIELSRNLASMTLALGGGATFQTIGTIDPTFATWSSMLSPDSTTLTIRFNPGEPAGVLLGAVGGGDNFVIGLPGDQGGTYSLSITSEAVPEPATWALLIAGFGFVGTALRRRRAAVTA
jgi:hypothetical protein